MARPSLSPCFIYLYMYTPRIDIAIPYIPVAHSLTDHRLSYIRPSVSSITFPADTQQTRSPLHLQTMLRPFDDFVQIVFWVGLVSKVLYYYTYVPLIISLAVVYE